MNNYKCNICLKEFEKKFNLERHLNNKKKPCKPINPQNPTIPPEIHIKPPENPTNCSENIIKYDNSNFIVSNNKNFCKYCGLVLSRKDHVKRHIDNFCKIKKDLDIRDKEKTEQIEELKKEIEEIEKLTKVNKSTKNSTINNTNNTNNTTNSNNTNTNNIVVNNNNIILPHGSESKVELKSILEKLAFHNDMLTIIPNMAKQIYIDTPENKNFRVLDLSRNKCEYYNGKKWVIGKTNEKILKLFNNVNNVLTGPFDKENLIKTLKFIDGNKELKEKIKWINFSKGYCLSLWDESDPENIENKKKIIDELKHIFFNYRDQILKIDLE